ncbi:MAG: CRISPR-associated helicase Cas3' [Desulfovibrio sp.]|nr:CRISPR-associated helicase Cas3' [Desulfovibrio sp.]
MTHGPHSLLRLYAHSTPGAPETWQGLGAHLAETANLAASFARSFDAGDWGDFCGRFHDVGKASQAFQKRLCGGKSVDHATAGGQLAFDLLAELGDFGASLAAFAIMGHHGGLPDGGVIGAHGGITLRDRRERKVEDYSRWPEALPGEPIRPQTLPFQITDAPQNERGFASAFFIRMLFSCLVDADWLDTERFCDPERFARRPRRPLLKDMYREFSAFARNTLAANNKGNEAIFACRQEILDLCQRAGQKPRGCFTLAVPTGGGKTFSSLAFALKHALSHGHDKIIYVIPFVSIIEQNAAAFRKALGPLGQEAVLEHHSSVTEPATEQATDADRATDLRLATENWDAALIVTTAVQFFESLFARQPSRCRKLHNIANSVIILDEAQMLPTELLNPCVMALRELARGYGASLVLCTATQPALFRTDNLYAGFEPGEVTDIITPERLPAIFELFKRVDIEQAGTLSLEAVAEMLAGRHQCLAIVNTRGRCRELYEILGQDEGNFHLSALMYPAHRRRKLEEIHARLKEGKACRVVSTSLVEAGVDIDFPLVLREQTGLDSVAQAAGRCNREGLLAKNGRVIVFSIQGAPPGMPFLRRRARAAASVGGKFDDPLCPAAIEAYFTRLYKLESLDEPGILGMLKGAMTDELLRKAPAMPFSAVAEAFRFIENTMEPVVVECDEALPLLARLEEKPDSEERPGRDERRHILRQLQNFTVQVYKNMLPRLALREIRPYGLKVLCGATGYSEDMGLVSDNPEFREAERNIL